MLVGTLPRGPFVWQGSGIVLSEKHVKSDQ